MDDKPVSNAKPSFLRSISAVAWSFLGVRSKKGYQDDLAKVNPLHVMLIGFIGIFVLVLGLIALVNWVVGK